MEDEKTLELTILIERLKKQLQLKIDLIALEIGENVAKTIANIISSGAVIGIVILFFVFASISLAFYAGTMLNSLWQGFLAVAGIYLIFGIITFLVKDGFIERKLIDVFVRILFKGKNNDNNTEQN